MRAVLRYFVIIIIIMLAIGLPAKAQKDVKPSVEVKDDNVRASKATIKRSKQTAKGKHVRKKKIFDQKTTMIPTEKKQKNRRLAKRNNGEEYKNPRGLGGDKDRKNPEIIN